MNQTFYQLNDGPIMFVGMSWRPISRWSSKPFNNFRESKIENSSRALDPKNLFQYDCRENQCSDSPVCILKTAKPSQFEQQLFVEGPASRRDEDDLQFRMELSFPAGEMTHSQSPACGEAEPCRRLSGNVGWVVRVVEGKHAVVEFESMAEIPSGLHPPDFHLIGGCPHFRLFAYACLQGPPFNPTLSDTLLAMKTADHQFIAARYLHDLKSEHFLFVKKWQDAVTQAEMLRSIRKALVLRQQKNDLVWCKCRSPFDHLGDLPLYVRIVIKFNAEAFHFLSLHPHSRNLSRHLYTFLLSVLAPTLPTSTSTGSTALQAQDPFGERFKMSCSATWARPDVKWGGGDFMLRLCSHFDCRIARMLHQAKYFDSYHAFPPPKTFSAPDSARFPVSSCFYSEILPPGTVAISIPGQLSLLS